MATIQEKRPRHYAAEIIALTTREERRDALARVPDHLRDWVAYSVRIHFEKKQTQSAIQPISDSATVSASASAKPNTAAYERGIDAVRKMLS